MSLHDHLHLTLNMRLLIGVDHWCRRCGPTNLTARARYGLALVLSRLALHVVAVARRLQPNALAVDAQRWLWSLLVVGNPPPCNSCLIVPWLLNHRACLAGVVAGASTGAGTRAGAGAGATTRTLLLHRVSFASCMLVAACCRQTATLQLVLLDRAMVIESPCVSRRSCRRSWRWS